MASDCRNATVRVWRLGSQGTPAIQGAGVHLGNGRILTCAHVVSDALGLARNVKLDTSARVHVHVDFPFAPFADQTSSLLAAAVEAWELDEGGRDAAVLQLTGPPPQGDEMSVRLLDVAEPRGHLFHVLGFPFGHDDGVEAFGKFRGKTARRWVQLAVEPGYGITEGFSGAPVWDEEEGGCVGIIVGKEGTQVDAALLTPLSAGFMIPTNLLQAFAPAIGSARMPRAAQGAGVPVLPPYYLPRSEHETIRQWLFAADAHPRIQIVGMPGLGKTALAIAIARDESVRAAFPDGVFWVSLGRDADVTAAQARLIADARAAGLTNDTDLSTLFRGARALVVLDDVWTAKDLSALMVDEMAAVMVTTRFKPVCASCRTVSLSTLHQHDALRVLAGWAEVDVEDLPDAAKHVAERCGYLPLALSLAGAMARGRSHPWEDILQQLDTVQLPEFAPAIAASEATLSNSSREKFRDLAVFPEDTPIPERVLAHWWKLPLVDARDIIYDWQDRALVQTVGHDAIRLHDLVQDYVRGVMRDELPARHLAFLAAYGATPGDVPTSRDPYFLEHFAFHLIEAGQPEALHALLSATDSDGRNAWWRIRDDVEQLAGYVADVVRAQQLVVDGSGADLARHMRYAMMQASIGTLSGSVPQVLVRQLVKQGLWSLNRAFMSAHRIPNPDQRASVLVDLLALTPSALLPQRREDAILATDHVGDVRTRAELLATLARTIDDDAAAADAILSRANGFAEAAHASRVWTALADRLSDALREDVRQRAFSRMAVVRAGQPARSAPTAIFMDWRRDRLALVEACTALMLAGEPGHGPLPPALATEINAAIEFHGTLVVAGELYEIDDGRLWPRVESLFPDFSLAVHRLTDEALKEQASFFMRLLPLLDERARRRIITTALALDQVERYQFVKWTPLLRPDERPLVVEAIERVSHRYSRIDWLSHVTPLMGERDRPALAERVLDLASTEFEELDRRGDVSSREALLADVARVGPWLSGQRHRVLITKLEQIGDPELRARALARAVRGMAVETRRPHLATGLLFARLVRDSDRFHRFVSEVGEDFPDDLLMHALAMSQWIVDRGWLLASMRQAWPYLDDDGRETFLTWGAEVMEALKEYEQRELIVIDAPKFIERQRISIVDSVRAMREPDERALALAALAAVAPETEKPTLLAEAKAAFGEVTNAISRADILCALMAAAPSPSVALVDEAIEAAFAIDSSSHRAKAVIACFKFVADADRDCLIARLRDSLEHDEKPVAGLAILAEHLPLEDVRRLVGKYRWSSTEGHNEIMPALLARLVELGEVEHAVDVLMRDEMDDDSANPFEMLKALVPGLPRHLIDRVMPVIDRGDLSWYRNELVVLVATRRAELGDVERAEADARTLTTSVARAEALIGIGRHAPASMRDRFFEESARLLATCSQADGWNLAVELGEASAHASPACARRVVQQISTIVSGWQRRAAASVLGACVPTLAKLEGAEGVRAYFRAVADVREWWP